MAQKPDYPKKIIQNYLKKISQKIKIKGALLFGSYAYGKPTKHSDVDLIVISPDFKKMKDRLFWLTSQREGVATSIPMDVFGFTPQEFKKIEKESAIIGYAKKHGKWIYK